MFSLSALFIYPPKVRRAPVRHICLSKHSDGRDGGNASWRFKKTSVRYLGIKTMPSKISIDMRFKFVLQMHFKSAAFQSLQFLKCLQRCCRRIFEMIIHVPRFFWGGEFSKIKRLRFYRIVYSLQLLQKH